MFLFKHDLYISNLYEYYKIMSKFIKKIFSKCYSEYLIYIFLESHNFKLKMH